MIEMIIAYKWGIHRIDWVMMAGMMIAAFAIDKIEPAMYRKFGALNLTIKWCGKAHIRLQVWG